MICRLIWSLGLALGITLPVAAQDVVITELMYHPISENVREEWIELHNRGATSVDLDGWRFSEGVDFVFPSVVIPAGGYLAVAADLDAFRALYPGVNNVVGGWTGFLNNNGEDIVLEDWQGIEIDRIEYGVEGDWGTRRRGPLDRNYRGWEWFAEHDGFGKSLEVINLAFDREVGQNWAASIPVGGTPGAPNSVAAGNVPPAILDVQNFPVVPRSTNAVTITARLLDETGTGLAATVWSRTLNNPFAATPMFDDGQHGDGGAGDGVFGAVLPAQPNLTVVEFYVAAQDAEGLTRTWPAPALNEFGGFVQGANLHYQVDNSVYEGSQPFYRVIMTAAEQQEFQTLWQNSPNSDAEMNATFITVDAVATEVRFTCGIRLRGAGSRNGNPKNFRVNLPSDRPWKGISEINLNSRFPHAQLIGSEIAKRAGLPVSDARLVQVRLNAQNFVTSSSPSYGSYVAVEPVNGDFAENHFPDDPEGNVYRASTGNHSANLSYLGTNPGSYISAGYSKTSNRSENDWSDLVELTSVLNNTPNDQYLSELNRVARVDKWLTYFAALSLMEYSETSLASGRGDDYAMYRGVLDPRFYLIGHDFDTIFGEGGAANVSESVFVAEGAGSAVSRFMNFPAIVPLYYAELFRLANGVFATNELYPVFDRVLTGVVPQPIVDDMKTFAANRTAYVRSQIQLSLTATSTLASVDGYLRTSNAAVALNGRGNVIRTRAIVVNGVPATWNPRTGTWNSGAHVLNPGINRFLVQALDAAGQEFERAYLNVFAERSTSTPVTGTLEADATWTPAGGPYELSGTTTVPAGVTLTIQPGTTVFLGQGATLTVNGRLLAEGTETQRIRFTRRPGSGNVWSGLRFVNAAAEQRLVCVDFERGGAGGSPNLFASGSVLYLDRVTWTNTTSQLLDLSSCSITLLNSVLPTIQNDELIHFQGMPANGHALVQGNVFGTTSGYNDIIDWTGGNRPGPIVQFLDNVFTAAVDDVLDLDGTDAHIEGNLFLNVHQDAPRDSGGYAISTGVDSGNTAEIVVVRNVFYDCDHALLLKEGASAVFDHNTVVGIRTNTPSVALASVINFSEPNRGVTGGAGATLDGNIFWDIDSNRPFLNFTNGLMTLTVNRTLIPGTNHPGLGNLSADPRFVNPQSSGLPPSALRTALALRAGSPALGAGQNGLDLGALVPAGASIAGEPPPLTAATSATLTVAGPGITHYRYAVNGGGFLTNEFPVGTPIELNGLTNGSYIVAAIGRNSAGAWQAISNATLSRTWTVNTAYAEVRLNELLARNVTTLEQGGEFPDLVEFHNPGGAPVDLSGLSVSDDPAVPKKFVFPPDTVLAPGGYLVVFADAATGGGLHLGFALGQEGDALYLYGADGSVLDSVAFGLQLADLSIGRLADGSWGLTVPTFGGPNVAQPTGDARALKINEWLANTQTTFQDDFLELYNPELLPVNLGGLHLSDAPPGAPKRHEIPALSFVAARGHAVFIADGDETIGPNHVNFRLSADQGTIGLLDADGGLLDCVVYPPQLPDISQGRLPDGSLQVGYINPPTPGAPNPASGTSVTVTNVVIPLFGITDKLWRYDNSGTDFGVDWLDDEFDDSAWPTGFGLFGFEPDNNYPLPFQTPIPAVDDPGGQLTVYFRTTFQWTNTLDFGLTATVYLDDGAVVYLNGVEAGRLRISANPVLYSSRADNQTAEGRAEILVLNTAGLRPGQNVLQVEVHQPNFTSTDVAFGLGLAAVKTETNITFLNLVLNEVMANNLSVQLGADTNVTDWVELYNPTTNTIDLAGMSLTDSPAEPRRWLFPAGVTLAPGGYLLVQLNPDAPASTVAGGRLNAGFGLNEDGDGMYLFESDARGGGQVDSLAFGLQAADYSLARIPNGMGGWRLALPTPGGVNIEATLGTPLRLKINEWLADPPSGEDDYFELYNPEPQPVALGGLYVSDDLNDRTEHRIAALSFIGVGEQGFVRFLADGNVDRGPEHVSFSLSRNGDSLAVFTADGTRIDGVTFGPQDEEVSEGRFPDGADSTSRFPNTPTPGASNLRQLTEIVINEVLTHTDPPLEDAIELFNPTLAAVDVSGWYLTDRRNDPRKFRIPDGTVLQPGGFAVFYENQFNPSPGLYPSFALSSTEGDDLYLFTADALGNLTGYRAAARFGAAANGVAIGRHETSVGEDFTALSQRTFGADTPGTLAEFRTGTGRTNAYPRVGPVVISEIMYNPPNVGTNENVDDEFVELHNFGAAPVPLFDPAFPTNTWRLRDGVDFDFPPGVTLPAGGHLLVVSFDPATDAAALSAFRTRYGLGPEITIFGPYVGRLASDGENLELYRPDEPVLSGPDTGFVPYIETDKVKYADAAPWPAAADGAVPGLGASLQRRVMSDYGNDPVNWLAGTPTPGAASGPALAALPSISDPPDSQTVAPGVSVSFSVVASGAAPLRYQWRFRGTNLPGATNATLFIANAQLAHFGNYTVLVANDVGAALSPVATLTVEAPPRIVRQPEHRSTAAGGTVRLAVVAEGAPPLRYQWRLEEMDLPGETNAVLVINDLQPAKEGNYRVVVRNDFGAETSLPANVSISAVPQIVQQPVGTNVFVGATAAFSVQASGSQPLRYQWRFNSANIPGATNASLVLTNVQLTNAGLYRVLVTNAVGAELSAPATLVVAVPPFVNVVATTPTASEAGLAGGFTLSRSGATTSPLTVNLSVAGTATPGADYQSLPASLIIPAGAASVPLAVTPVDDAVREAQESVVLTVAPGADYAVGSLSGSATVMIADDDNVLPTVAITNPVAGTRFTTPTNLAIAATAAPGNGSLARVEFFAGGTNLLGVVAAAPYQITWTNAPAGNHLLTAVAVDDVGARAVSAPVAIVVVPPGFGDLFAERGRLSGYTNQIAGNNATYTKEPGEPRHHHNGLGNGAKSAWLSWTAPGSGTVTMDTLGSAFDTILVVYTNRPSGVETLTNLVRVASNDDMDAGTVQSRLSFAAVAGGVYQIAVDGFASTAGGAISFRLTMPNPNPVITTQPQSLVVNPGATATFSVVAGGPGPLRFQWYFEGSPLEDATNALLTLTDVTPAAEGTYGVVVSNDAAAVASQPATLALRRAPTITAGLSNLVVNPAGSATFAVTAGGAGPFTYLWRFNGTLLPGASGSTLVRQDIQHTNAGMYSVTVSNALGSAESQAELIVRPELVPSPSGTNGVFVLRLRGTPGKTYTVLASSNLVHWGERGTVNPLTVDAEFSDPAPASAPRYYQLRLEP